jgi:hypothetical protein
VLWLLLLSAAVSSCLSLRVGDYDEVTDQEATRLQKEMDRFLTRLEGLPANDAGQAYGGNQDFYDAFGVDLRALTTRAASLPNNARTAEQLTLMQANLDSLRSAHRAQNRLSAPALRLYRDLFAAGWQAILTLELAKRRE